MWLPKKHFISGRNQSCVQFSYRLFCIFYLILLIEYFLYSFFFRMSWKTPCQISKRISISYKSSWSSRLQSKFNFSTNWIFENLFFARICFNNNCYVCVTLHSNFKVECKNSRDMANTGQSCKMKRISVFLWNQFYLWQRIETLTKVLDSTENFDVLRYICSFLVNSWY